jgi:hypothetical protein
MIAMGLIMSVWSRYRQQGVCITIELKPLESILHTQYWGFNSFRLVLNNHHAVRKFDDVQMPLAYALRLETIKGCRGLFSYRRCWQGIAPVTFSTFSCPTCSPKEVNTALHTATCFWEDSAASEWSVAICIAYLQFEYEYEVICLSLFSEPQNKVCQSIHSIPSGFAQW